MQFDVPLLNDSQALSSLESRQANLWRARFIQPQLAGNQVYPSSASDMLFSFDHDDLVVPKFERTTANQATGQHPVTITPMCTRQQQQNFLDDSGGVLIKNDDSSVDSLVLMNEREEREEQKGIRGGNMEILKTIDLDHNFRQLPQGQSSLISDQRRRSSQTERKQQSRYKDQDEMDNANTFMRNFHANFDLNQKSIILSQLIKSHQSSLIDKSHLTDTQPAQRHPAYQQPLPQPHKNLTPIQEERSSNIQGTVSAQVVKEREMVEGKKGMGAWFVVLMLLVLSLAVIAYLGSQNFKHQAQLASIQHAQLQHLEDVHTMKLSLQSCEHQHKTQTTELEVLRKVEKEYLEVKREMEDIARYMIDNYNRPDAKPYKAKQ
ncbi:hypothetical protein FGO68_gene7653 [Halteria grandinella]|uniref:Uncharacterized protein n=1 Tax=Halteria grandinella TaxID=5974 RepID=A0A8J8P4E8_HALGN|nr:hypothetical protein FGO68_gene7653 [Halteria grandinella]